jgi:hypothetical protein
MENPRHWRLKAPRLRLQGSRCRACGSISFPPRPVLSQANAAQVGPSLEVQATYFNRLGIPASIASIAASRAESQPLFQATEKIAG